MSLTQDDLREIKTVVRDVSIPLESKIDKLDGKVDAIEEDVKEIYRMIARKDRSQQPVKNFLKLSIEKKILSVNRDLQVTAKEAGITLPRNI